MHCPSYYDEDGKLHNHDSNTSSTSMSCSNGHRLNITFSKKCSNCDWGNNGKIIAEEYCGPTGETFSSTVSFNGYRPQDWKQVGQYDLEEGAL